MNIFQYSSAYIFSSALGILMELELLEECKTLGVSVFSVGKKKGMGKSYANLDEVCADFISGLKSLMNPPRKILIFERSIVAREYVAEKLRKKGYCAFNAKKNAPKTLPERGEYFILMDYFLKKISPPAS
jgi:hypothetical protein